jgi:hypothetical protein
LDLSRSVTYRTVDLNSITALAPDTAMSGYLLNDVRFLDVEGWGYKEKRSQGDGYDSSRVYLGTRKLSIRGTIYSLSIAELHDKMRTIRALFTPTLCYNEDPTVNGYLPLTFDIPTSDTGTWATGYIPVKLLVRPMDQPGGMFPREMAFGKATGGFSTVYEVMLEAVDPRIYLQTTTDIAATTTTASSSVTNDGDYPAPLQAILALTAVEDTGQRSITFTGMGTVMTVTIPASSNDRQVNIDSELKVCTLTDNGVETLRMDLVSFAAGYTWPLVQPEANSYDWTTVGGAPGAGSKFWFYETFA